MDLPITPDRCVGNIVTVQQSDGTPKVAEIIKVEVDPDRDDDDPNRVRYCCKWGDRITQWDWFYAPQVH